MHGSLLLPPAYVVAEVEVDEDLLSRLLRVQHPELADESIERFAEGWDNTLFRVGRSWLARLPRRAVSAPLVELEVRWLPVLAPALPLEIPVPAREGRPGAGYPWRWSISRWLDGGPAAGTTLEPLATAAIIGGFLKVLHSTDPPGDAPTNGHRGVPPRKRTKFLLERLDGIRGRVDAVRLERAWRAFASVPDWTGRRVWCHGDMHPFNLLAVGDRLSAVLDWGDLHVGEPAPDLAVVWMLLPHSAHPHFREVYGAVDESTWQRARAWALYFGVMFIAAGEAGAGAAATRLGETTLARVLD